MLGKRGASLEHEVQSGKASGGGEVMQGLGGQ